MKKLLGGAVVLMVAGCALVTPPSPENYDRINAELAKGAATKAVPDAVSAALLPPLAIEMPKTAPLPEERFNVSFSNLPANQFFAALASGTRYNMLVHPGVTGNVTVNLKNVTLMEALDAVRDLYGYEYTVEGNRIFVKPLEIQTRIFQVNYLTGIRRGISDIRVTSGASGDTSSAPQTSSAPSFGGTTTTTTGASSPKTVETSKVNTTSTTDFWTDLKVALEAIIGMERFATAGGVPGAAGAAPSTAASSAAAALGTTTTGLAATSPAAAAARLGVASAQPTLLPCRGGRCVVVNPQSGVVVVTAYPAELRNVAAFLRATQLSVDRQVMLEAKIIEVQLNDSFQTGVNWSSFARFSGNTTNQVAGGVIAPGTTLLPLAPGTNFPQAISSAGGTQVNATPGLNISTPAANIGTVFGLAFQATNFAALISFLETQGTVHVLSSPRVATMNNQKAVLKIGVDELFVTNVTPSSTVATSGTSQIQPPSVTLQSYFSGIVLDVTPQIDDRGNITLHIRPSVSQVTSVNKQVDVGGLRPFVLPVPSSNTSETDTIVRGRDGAIIAIGGLMRYSSSADTSQVPNIGNLPILGAAFRNRNETNQKRELVILLKPTILAEGANWAEDIIETQRRVESLNPRQKWPEGLPQQ